MASRPPPRAPRVPPAERGAGGAGQSKSGERDLVGRPADARGRGPRKRQRRPVDQAPGFCVGLTDSTHGGRGRTMHTPHTHTLWVSGQTAPLWCLDSASACATAPLSASPTTSTVRTPKRPIRDNAMQWHIATPCMRDATTLSGQRPFSTQNVHSLCRGIHFTVWGQRDSTLMDSVVPLECGHGPNSSHRRSQAKWRSLFLSSHSRMAGQD